VKLTLINRIRLCVEILTIKGRNKSPAYEKQLSTFMRGYDSGRNDESLNNLFRELHNEH
jgi:hypothetical protein